MLGSICAVITTVTVWLATIVPSEIEFAGCGHVMFGVQVSASVVQYCAPSRCESSGSLNVTACASDGPLFWIVLV